MEEEEEEEEEAVVVLSPSGVIMKDAFNFRFVGADVCIMMYAREGERRVCMCMVCVTERKRCT